MTRYVKTIVAVLGGVSAWGITASADNAITQVELYGLLGVIATALGVYAFPNSPPAGEPADPEISERGMSEIGLVLLTVIVVIVVLVAAGTIHVDL